MQSEGKKSKHGQKDSDLFGVLPIQAHTHLHESNVCAESEL